MDYITWMWWALSQSFSYTAAYYCRCIMLKMWNPLKNQNLNELAFMKCRSDLEIQCSKKLSDGNFAQASEQIGAWMLRVKTTINCVINEMSQWPKRKLFQVTLHLMASQLAAFITPEQRRHSCNGDSIVITLNAQWQMSWTKVQEIPKPTNE